MRIDIVLPKQNTFNFYRYILIYLLTKLIFNFVYSNKRYLIIGYDELKKILKFMKNFSNFSFNFDCKMIKVFLLFLKKYYEDFLWTIFYHLDIKNYYCCYLHITVLYVKVSRYCLMNSYTICF